MSRPYWHISDKNIPVRTVEFEYFKAVYPPVYPPYKLCEQHVPRKKTPYYVYATHPRYTPYSMNINHESSATDAHSYDNTNYHTQFRCIAERQKEFFRQSHFGTTQTQTNACKNGFL